ncbi:hypothetical protein TcasGA2_TC031974 [Tribolium castaneum]|uniref:Uncharacterized protein n=1 Tax=Tribolium castaneum TaxID=7070 RepID=A0A139WNU7_TRICA|nr:hypothetical protein TcasGA2_TC031974 [Tribolium castaneum]
MPIFDCVIYTEQHIRDVEEDETPIRNTAVSLLFIDLV